MAGLCKFDSYGYGGPVPLFGVKREIQIDRVGKEKGKARIETRVPSLYIYTWFQHSELLAQIDSGTVKLDTIIKIQVLVMTV